MSSLVCIFNTKLIVTIVIATTLAMVITAIALARLEDCGDPSLFVGSLIASVIFGTIGLLILSLVDKEIKTGTVVGIERTSIQIEGFCPHGRKMVVNVPVDHETISNINVGDYFDIASCEAGNGQKSEKKESAAIANDDDRIMAVFLSCCLFAVIGICLAVLWTTKILVDDENMVFLALFSIVSFASVLLLSSDWHMNKFIGMQSYINHIGKLKTVHTISLICTVVYSAFLWIVLGLKKMVESKEEIL